MVCANCFGGCLLLAVLTAPECFNLREGSKGGCITLLSCSFLPILFQQGKRMGARSRAIDNEKRLNPHRAIRFIKFDAKRTRWILPPYAGSYILDFRLWFKAPYLFPCRKRYGRKGHLRGCSPPKNPQGWGCSNRRAPQGQFPPKLSPHTILAHTHSTF